MIQKLQKIVQNLILRRMKVHDEVPVEVELNFIKNNN